MTEGLERFVAAQEPVWTQVVSELAEGRKRSHWMWFVFPQIAGLGDERDLACATRSPRGRRRPTTSTTACSARGCARRPT